MTGEETESRVIRPPMEDVVRGKVFRPSDRLIAKDIVLVLIIATLIWLVVLLSGIGVVYLNEVVGENAHGIEVFWAIVNSNWILASLIIWEVLAFFVVPAIVLIPFLIRSYEYSIVSESGQTMPEVFVKKGIFNVTKKHVPFRTITNIASRAGPFDRLFGIGNVEIETAGYSGPNQQGPEQKLEGIVFYEEVRDFILQELRKYRGTYVTATEVVERAERPVPSLEDSLMDEVLITLRQIRDNMRPLGEILEILRKRRD